MIVHPTFPALRLFEPTDLGEPTVREVIGWATDYLVRPHPEVGRKGPVCPYAQGSLNRGHFFVNVVEGTPTTAAELAFAIRPYRDWFLELAPRERPGSAFTTILNAFPGLTDFSLVDEVQRALRTYFVADGLMVGEFHDGPPDKGGLWNPAWRPLRSPVPLLAIRHMVASDLPFLEGSPDLVAVHRALFGGTAL
ncbi:MAG TPA: hypothetical protein VD813_06635 [Pseudonocardia sp.]|nr:hypothetical protein [Pseudonocardia sp.]